MEGKAGDSSMKQNSKKKTLHVKKAEATILIYTNKDAHLKKMVLPSSVVQGVVQRRLCGVYVLLHVHKRPDGKELTVWE